MTTTTTAPSIYTHSVTTIHHRPGHQLGMYVHYTRSLHEAREYAQHIADTQRGVETMISAVTA